MPYVVGTDPCSYLLSDDGICVRVQPTGNTQVSPSAQAPQTPQTAVVGAQFVAGLDVSVPGGLVGGLEIGSAALFVKQDDAGRFVLLRTAPIRSVTERGLKKKPPLPKRIDGDETTLTQIKTAIPRPPPVPREAAAPKPSAPVVPAPRPPTPSQPHATPPPPPREIAPLVAEPPTARRNVDPELVRRASSPSIAPPPLPRTIVPPAMQAAAGGPPPAPPAPQARPTVERDASGVPIEAIPKGTRPDLPAPPIFHLTNQSRPMAPSVFPSPWDEPPTNRLLRDDMKKAVKKKKK